MKHKYLLFISVLFAHISVAQNSIRPNIYLQDMQYYNPASVALDSNQSVQIALYGKQKFVDNEDAIWKKPMNLWLAHAGRIGQSNSFYTISYVSDQYSYFNRNSVYLGYARQSRIGKLITIGYGARLVGNFDHLNWKKFILPHTQEGKVLLFNPDLDLGATLQLGAFQTGVGLKNVLATAYKLEDAVLIRNRREVNVNFSYRQKIVGTRFVITPFLLMARERNTMLDGGLCFGFSDKLELSYALRVNELKSVIALNAALSKNWSIGMAYDRSSLVSDNNVDIVVRFRK